MIEAKTPVYGKAVIGSFPACVQSSTQLYAVDTVGEKTSSPPLKGFQARDLLERRTPPSWARRRNWSRPARRTSPAKPPGTTAEGQACRVQPWSGLQLSNERLKPGRHLGRVALKTCCSWRVRLAPRTIWKNSLKLSAGLFWSYRACK